MPQTLTVLLALLSVTSSLPRRCQRPAEQIYRYSTKPVITEAVLRAATEVALDISEKCINSEVYIEHNRKSFAVGSVTRLYGRICQKSSSPAAVAAFVRYRVQHWHSADEELSLAMERVFVSKPEATLRYIRTQPDSVRKQLLNDITWGFLSNRVYGPVDPYEEFGRRTFAPGERIPQEVLNRKNYRQIFLNLHPGIKALGDTYAREFEIILSAAGTFLNTWGVEY